MPRFAGDRLCGARGLGRALGLVILQGVNLGFLRMRADFSHAQRVTFLSQQDEELLRVRVFTCPFSIA